MSENELPKNPGFKVGDRVKAVMGVKTHGEDSEYEGVIITIDDPVVDHIPVEVSFWLPEDEFGDSVEVEEYFGFDQLTRIEERRGGRERPARETPDPEQIELQDWERELLEAGGAYHDPINHPSHYTSYKDIEVIQLTRQLNFDRGNAVKYIARAGLKGDAAQEIEDLKKAAWYIKDEIERLESK